MQQLASLIRKLLFLLLLVVLMSAPRLYYRNLYWDGCRCSHFDLFSFFKEGRKTIRCDCWFFDVLGCDTLDVGIHFYSWVGQLERKNKGAEWAQQLLACLFTLDLFLSLSFELHLIFSWGNAIVRMIRYLIAWSQDSVKNLFFFFFFLLLFFYFWATDLFSCFMFNKNPRPKLSPISANYPLPQITLYKHSFELHVRRRKFVSPEMREQYHNLPFKTKLAWN